MSNSNLLKGNATEAAVLADLLRLGYDVLLPWGGHSRYDLAVDLSGRLVRIQCKTAWVLDESTIRFKARGNSGKGLGYTGHAEVFGLYCAERNLVLYVPVEDVPACQVDLHDAQAFGRQRQRLIGEYLKPPF
jgi:hypothetical protein